MNQLQNLYINEHKDLICELIARHISARLIVVDARNDIGNRIGWSVQKEKAQDLIFLPRTISAGEQLSAIMDMVTFGQTRSLDRFTMAARKLLTAPSVDFLKYLVLHEIAHLKYRWSARQELECHLWAMEQLYE